MQEKVDKTKIANVDASLMSGKNLINVWLTQQFDNDVQVYVIAVQAVFHLFILKWGVVGTVPKVQNVGVPAVA